MRDATNPIDGIFTESGYLIRAITPKIEVKINIP
jgi:hypothetical protein